MKTAIAISFLAALSTSAYAETYTAKPLSMDELCALAGAGVNEVMAAVRTQADKMPLTPDEQSELADHVMLATSGMRIDTYFRAVSGLDATCDGSGFDFRPDMNKGVFKR